ncbi:hypothetical protein OESDEN_07636 [Oesophagostomum dentatum]|uniref:Uncharacterized protein n=1 Tax=Oesophagostomum dentatum TaxID=61180 RepID=A0A0B1T5F7_OESDE|nr:hypothetical protein OESDEN_07636 [Oesophagostomum dentatum]
MSISIVCPCCHFGDLETPEQLCDHVSSVHKTPAPIHEQFFEDGAQLQAWLSEVEDSRTEGGYVGSEEGPSSDDKEYYLLCRRRVSPMLKRRRLAETTRFIEAEGSIVSCTAFVHVMERVDGSNLKRSSQSISDSYTCPTENSVTLPRIQSTDPAVFKDAEMMCGDIIEDNNNINTMKKVSFCLHFGFLSSFLVRELLPTIACIAKLL